MAEVKTHLDSTAPVSELLIKNWLSCGITIADGASPETVAAFEASRQVQFPDDVREYFLRVNGMVQEGYDSEDPRGFAFLPISRLKDLDRVSREEGITVPGVEPRDYFLFVIYMQWCWAYAIDLGHSSVTRGQVVHVGTIAPKIVARSFSEFVHLYLSDSTALYPD